MTNEIDETKEAIECLLKVFEPSELLILAKRASQVHNQGWGELTIRFVNGKPILLLTNISDKLSGR